MKNEPAFKLAMSMHENPGTYAVLIGSGVSKAAGIPTGWEIAQDLIKKVATMQKVKAPPDLGAWYQQTFGEAPDYDKLLDSLSTTPTERAVLLRSYFEPTEEEKERGLKIPTPAHRAIAKLAKIGCVRIILTTNFDCLMERALEEEGIVPDIVSSDDTLKGAIPYVHSKCFVVKLHGDYRDTRIKNTSEELANYSKEMNDFLDRIFDEFGLITCGWSSKWDTALKNAILRTPTRRFTTFWLAKGKPVEDTQNIIQQRRAKIIQIASADQFFTELLEKVESLQELKERSNPLSTAVAAATVKRYLVEPRHRIRLHDLIQEEIERVCKELSSERFETETMPTKDFFQKRMREYELLVERLLAMLTALSYHDTGENTNLLTRCIERLMQVSSNNGSSILIKLQYYPALLVTYATGISALASKRFKNVAAVMKEPKYADPNTYGKKLTISKLYAQAVFGDRTYLWLPRTNASSEYTPTNDYLFDLLRPILRDYLPDELSYVETFDIFEYLLALMYLDQIDKKWCPQGRFSWRYGSEETWKHSPLVEFAGYVFKQGYEWGLLKAGFFNEEPGQFIGVVDIHKGLLFR